MKNTIVILISVLLFFFSCTEGSDEKSGKTAPEGRWIGKIHSQGKEIPFSFNITQNQDNDLKMSILNDSEEIITTGLYWRNDSLIIPLHIFDTEIRTVVESGSMSGYWIKNYVDNYQLYFTATKGDKRFPQVQESTAPNSLNGKWAVSFEGRKSYQRPYNAIGLFEQDGNHLSGTFLTPTGDYRFLEGVIHNKEFTLSSFDGENAYLFEGEILHDQTLKGTFWSGKGRKEEWTASKNEQATLPDAESLTFLKDGHDRLNFEFPDLEGNLVSLNDPRYHNKVIIVQILGSWCPNCMDETRFLGEWYRKHKNEEVAIIGLAYEKKDDFDYARQRVQNMATKLEADYDFLIAGTPDKESTARSLPMLNHIMSFPTTLFIDKTGKVRRIHTGFYGPGTGHYYTEFVEEFNEFMEELIEE